MAKPRNVYMVWTEDYYLFLVAHSHSHAKYLYADFGGWGGEYFEKQPEGFWMQSRIIEHDVPFECGELWNYEETAGVDLMLSGVLHPLYMCDDFSASDEHDYRRWNGFRKATLTEQENAHD